MSTEQRPRPQVRGPHRWVPLAWSVYGAAYIAVLLARREFVSAAIGAVVVAAIAVGTALELRSPVAMEPRLLGWRQDERQRGIHQQAMALVGYAAMGATLIGGFMAFAADSRLNIWLMPAMAALLAVYGTGLAVYRRRS